MILQYTKTNPTATFSKSHHTDGGWDLSVINETRIESLSNALIDSGVRVSIPEGYFGLLLGRSSLSTKLNCSLITGVIDSGYRGNILMNIRNDDEYYPRILKVGTRVAQLVVIPIYTGVAEEVMDLGDTDRGAGGFGSTDKDTG